MPLGFFDPDDPLGLKKLGAWPALPGNYDAGAGVATLNPAPPATNWLSGGYPARQPVFDPAYNAETARLGTQQGVINAGYGVNQANRGVLQAGYGVNAAEQAQMPFKMASLNANRGVLQARQGTFGAQQGVINANYGVQGAQGAQIAGQRGFIGQQQQENTAQRGEYEAQLAAQNNVPDQQAVATFKRYQAAKDSRNRALGITPDQEIDVPVGFTGQLGPGVRARATTQAEDVARTNKENQTKRGFDLESAKLAVQLMATDVDQARLVAAQAGLTLDQAQLGVQQAENAAGFARNAEDVSGLDVTRAKLSEDYAGLGAKDAQLNEDTARLDNSQAGLDYESANRAPFPGAERYTDPYTGRREWMTPSEADHMQYQYATDRNLSHIPTEDAISQQRKLFDTRNDTGPASALDQYSTQQLLNLYVDPSVYTAPWANKPNVSLPAVADALVRKLIKQGYTDAGARDTAKQLIEIEMSQRAEAAAKKTAGGTPNLTVDENGKIVVKP